MPIYEYRCTACEFSFEERQGFDAEAVCSCPKCRREARRQFRPAPIIFKGSGFYVTDHPSSRSSTLKQSTDEDRTEPAVARADAKHEGSAVTDK